MWEPGWNSNQSLHKFQAEVGGAMLGGSAGVRLIEPGATGDQQSPEIPNAFRAPAGSWILTAQYQLFGSDELTAQSAPVEEMITPVQMSLSPGDAEQLNLGPQDGVAATLEGMTVNCRVRIDPGVPVGTAGLTLGLPTAPSWRAGEAIALERLPDFARPPEVLASDSEVVHG